MSSDICSVLAEDPDLGQDLDPLRRVHAERACRAPCAVVEPGQWQPLGLSSMIRAGLGLLVISGMMLRRVGHGGRFGAELLGPGDILRPWEHLGEQDNVGVSTEWRALAPTKVALLDRSFAARLAYFPEVYGALVGRALRRSRYLTTSMAIVHHPRVEVRLRTLFWHVSDRWGIVSGDGVRVWLPVTHSDLADLVAAGRATVSTALSHLSEEGLVHRSKDVWTLLGEPPSLERSEPGSAATIRLGVLDGASWDAGADGGLVLRSLSSGL